MLLFKNFCRKIEFRLAYKFNDLGYNICAKRTQTSYVIIKSRNSKSSINKFKRSR